MSPILVRPVREQLEHDRIIRLLQAKNRRKFDAGINPGHRAERRRRQRPVRALSRIWCCSSLDRGRRLQAIVEVETGESVNHLEALAEWAHFREAAGGISPVRPLDHGRCRSAAVRGQPDSRSTKSGAFTPSATKCALRSSTERVKPRPLRRAAPRRQRPRRIAATAQAIGRRHPRCDPRKAATRGRRRCKKAVRSRPNANKSVPFLRFSRDKRGYEHIYLVHTHEDGASRHDHGSVLVSDAARRKGRPPPFDEEVGARWKRRIPM